MDIFDLSLSSHEDALEEVKKIKAEIMIASSKINNALKKGNKLLIMGNGGSAADAQHFAAELVVRFKNNRSSFPAIALTTDSSIITAIGNDFSFDKIFSRQIESLANADDIVVVFSTSGNSQNIINGVIAAQKKMCHTIGFLGRNGGRLKELVDIPIIVKSTDTGRIQEAHMFIYHIMCELFEADI